MCTNVHNSLSIWSCKHKAKEKRYCIIRGQTGASPNTAGTWGWRGGLDTATTLLINVRASMGNCKTGYTVPCSAPAKEVRVGEGGPSLAAMSQSLAF